MSCIFPTSMVAPKLSQCWQSLSKSTFMESCDCIKSVYRAWVWAHCLGVASCHRYLVLKVNGTSMAEKVEKYIEIQHFSRVKHSNFSFTTAASYG